MNGYREVIEGINTKPFKYTCISALESEGLLCGSDPSDDITDERAIALIQLFSRYINTLTKQWFEPIYTSFSVSPRNRRLIYSPNLIPIIELHSFKYYVSGVENSLDSDEYIINHRSIELNKGISFGSNKCILTGVFGWLENNKHLSTETTEEIAAETSNSVVLTSISPASSYSVTGASERFDVGDLVIFYDSNLKELGRRIVTDVDLSNNKIIFDPFLSSELRQSIPVGSICKTYGRIPLEIQMVCNQFVIDNYNQRKSEDFKAEQLRRRIKSERTDDYRYDTHTMKGGGGYGLPDPSLTTDPILNRILDNYAAPGWIDGV